ncbi:uncharacterized protein EV420DRAFT_801262 [Desarmillaria tabescens]|uniref:Uncharacterized protein n=1 Tax=Armillaria tabescens TaxID=1929756 RepID=A0AA39NHV2_ARMTA|nr:uncharacterized protein EV420DRAFT_801262 [Desarmillaria tabescens]KAK0465916.1 hypothetical protein EV420DRAFT_801262 [Desarmillaria tabescens]
MASMYWLVLSKYAGMMTGPAMNFLCLWERLRSSLGKSCSISSLRNSRVSLCIPKSSIESVGSDLSLGELLPWEEARLKILPAVWKGPVTGELQIQVHPCGTTKLLVEHVPE